MPTSTEGIFSLRRPAGRTCICICVSLHGAVYVCACLEKKTASTLLFLQGTEWKLEGKPEYTLDSNARFSSTIDRTAYWVWRKGGPRT